MSGQLIIDLYSFSFREPLPQDSTDNGGGFVFDCRCLPNPGREERFKTMTGLDQEVIQYLEKEQAVREFFEHTSALVESALQNYLSRQFSHLMVSFGCTGGQHRSVYFVEKMAQKLKNSPDICIQLHHQQLTRLGLLENVGGPK